MSHLSEAILSAAQALPEGGLISPKEFLHLASRADWSAPCSLWRSCFNPAHLSAARIGSRSKTQFL